MFLVSKREHHRTAPSPLRYGGPGVLRCCAAGARQGPGAISFRSYCPFGIPAILAFQPFWHFNHFCKRRGGGIGNPPDAH